MNEETQKLLSSSLERNACTRIMHKLIHQAILPPLCLLLMAVTMMAAIGCTTLGDGGKSDEHIGAEHDTGLVHIHGLGINPKDGVLYAAAHTGLFRIPKDGQPHRVANRYQDTMGFTVVGPDHFLASGHPDVREMREKRLPPLLGLLESRDGGETWHPLSLLGEADFHALRAAHGRIYGWDSTSTAFMVSSDGKTWERRARLQVRDFVVSPSDPGLVLATTPAGLGRSTDGGHTWERVNAPPLALLSWEEPAALWGLSPNGAVYQSADAGAVWQQEGAINGSPVAFVADKGLLYVALHNGGIYVSADKGQTWRPHLQPT